MELVCDRRDCSTGEACSVAGIDVVFFEFQNNGRRIGDPCDDESSALDALFVLTRNLAFHPVGDLGWDSTDESVSQDFEPSIPL